MNRYVYQVSNRASLLVLLALDVLIGSVIIRALLPEGYEWVLPRVAWPLWGIGWTLIALRLRRRG